VLVRLPAQAESTDGTRSPAQARLPASSRARRRHPRLLRQHRSRQADEAGHSTRLGSEGAEADQAVARSGCDGRRRASVDDDRRAARRGDLAAPVKHLPARARHAVDASQLPTRDARALRRRPRRDVQDEAACRARRVRRQEVPGAPRARATSRQDEACRALRWKAGVRLPRLSFPQASERSDPGTRREAKILPASPAFATRDEADPTEGARQDVTRTMPRGPPRGDRRREPDPSRMGSVFRHRECSAQLQPDR
jgi:hypothetical protein